MRMGMFGVLVVSDLWDGVRLSSVVVPQICSQRGSSECAGRNHWRPICLAAFSRRALTA